MLFNGFANYSNHSVPLDDLALCADFFDGCFDFHFLLFFAHYLLTNVKLA